MALKLKTQRWSGSCPTHKRYDPVKSGVGGIRGGCRFCGLLSDIKMSAQQLQGVIDLFQRSKRDFLAAHPPEVKPKKKGRKK